MNCEFEYVGSELEVFAHAVRWKRYFARQLGPFIRGRVLEVGAGLGGTTRVLRTGAEVSWTCLEPDAQLVAKLEGSLGREDSQAGPAMKVVHGSIDDVESGSTYDTVLYIDVLEHIEDDRGELCRASRLLAPSGHLVVLCPAHPWLYSPFDQAVGHYRRYTRRTLKTAGPAELTSVCLRYLDAVGLLASLMNRLVLKASHPSAKQIRFWDNAMIPLSERLDPWLGYRLGKSVIGVWRREV